METEVQFGKMRKVWRWTGALAVSCSVKVLNVTELYTKMVNFRLCVFFTTIK